MYLHLTAATDISYMLVWVLWNNGSDAFSTFLTSHRSEIQSLDQSSHQKRQLNVPLHWKLAGKQLLYSKLKNRLSLDINWVGENNEFNKLKSDYSEIFAHFLKQFNKNFNNFQTFAPGRNPGWPSFITYKEIISIGRVVQRGPDGRSSKAKIGNKEEQILLFKQASNPTFVNKSQQRNLLHLQVTHYNYSAFDSFE